MNNYTIDTDNKFANFYQEELEVDLKADITLPTFFINISECLHKLKDLERELSYILFRYDISLSEKLVRKCARHNINIYKFEVYPLLISRQITLIKYLMERKYVEYSSIILGLDNYLNDNFLIYFENKEKYIRHIYESIHKDQNSMTKELTDIIIKSWENELEIHKYDIANPEFIPARTNLYALFRIIIYISEECLKDLEGLKTKYNNSDFINLLNIFMRLESLNDYIRRMYRQNYIDIFNIPVKSIKWDLINKHLIRRIYFDRKRMETILNVVKILFDWLNSSLSKGNSFRANKVFMTMIYMGYYSMLPERSLLQAAYFKLNPDLHVAKMTWNLPAFKVIKNFVKTSFPLIKISKPYYLKRMYTTISKDFLYSIYSIINRWNGEDFYSFLTNAGIYYFPTLIQNNLPKLVKRKLEYNSEYVRVRLIRDSESQKGVLIHIHGGGFIATSAATHENYTRLFSKKLDIPVIAIDYRLAPKYPFPSAIDDVFQAYLWLLINSKELKISIDKILLIGDSAGGNMVMSLINLLVLFNLRLPDSVYLAYPAVELDLFNIKISTLNSLFDPILPDYLLKYCIDSYKGDYKYKDDIFFSPSLTPDNIVKRYPKITIIFGSLDPLRDYIVEFLYNVA